MVNYEDMGRRIKIMRHERRLSQQQVAQMVNVSLSYFGNIERGVRIPSIDTLVDIANALNVGLDYLLAESVNAAIRLRSEDERRTVRNYLRDVILELSVDEDDRFSPYSNEKIK